MDDFDRFWASYPRKVGKLAAVAAYRKARRSFSAEEIQAGVEQYAGVVDLKEWRFICHPSTWLNQGRWMDEPIRPLPRHTAEPGDWYAECQAMHSGACGGSLKHHYRMAMDAERQRASVGRPRRSS